MGNEQGDSGAPGGDDVADRVLVPGDVLPSGATVMPASAGGFPVDVDSSAGAVEPTGCASLVPPISVRQWFPAKRIIIEAQASSWETLDAMLAELRAGYAKQNGVPAGTAMTVERNDGAERQFAQVLGRPE